MAVTAKQLQIQSQPTSVSYTLNQFQRLGVEHCFMVPGKMMQPFMLEMSHNKLTTIVAAHEAGAGFMADGYARASGKFGVCCAIAGPGAINFAPALAAAKADEIPIIAIGGGTARNLEGQGAFQDSTASGINDVDVLKPVTNYACHISSVDNVTSYMHEALRSMVSTKKGPVYLQMPVDVQQEELPEECYLDALQMNSACVDIANLSYVKDFLKNEEKKVVFLVGSRARNEQVTQALLTLSEAYQVPVATTLCSKGTFPEDHALSLGVFGFAGHGRANETLLGDKVDVIISLGVDFNQRNSVAWTEKLTANEAFIQIDPDNSKLNHFKAIDHSFVSDCGAFLGAIEKDTRFKQVSNDSQRQAWVNQVKEVPKHYDMTTVLNVNEPMHPGRAILELRKAMPRDTIVSVDSGIHRIFAGHYWESYAPNQYLTSAFMAPMGWAIPAGIGAKVAKPEQTSVVITGDGCMLMHGNEIQTAARYNIPVIFLVLNNGAHGGIHIESNKPDSFSPELTELPQHSWAKYASALGVTGYTVSKVEDLAAVYKEALALNKACVIDVHVGAEYKAPNYAFQNEMAELLKRSKARKN